MMIKRFLRQLLGPAADKPAATSFEAQSTLHGGGESATRQQLVMVSVRDVLRRNGIPAGWIECQTLQVVSRRRGAGLYVYLVFRQWDEELLHLVSAFQVEVRETIKKFDPTSTMWIHGIAWQFEVEDDCPYNAMPDKNFWQTRPTPGSATRGSTAPHAAQPTHTEEAFSINASNTATPSPQPTDVAQDLAKLFEIRDREIGSQGSQALPSAGYEKTQPSPLQGR